MCLVINKTARKQIAKKDIKVYKCLIEGRDGLLPPYMYVLRRSKFVYILNKIAKSNIGYKKDSHNINYTIEEGLHSYKDYIGAANQHVRFLEDKIYEAIIPKGSEYYISKDREGYVSNQLKIIKKL